jgi:hypothetical protein
LINLHDVINCEIRLLSLVLVHHPDEVFTSHVLGSVFNITYGIVSDTITDIFTAWWVDLFPVRAIHLKVYPFVFDAASWTESRLPIGFNWNDELLFHWIIDYDCLAPFCLLELPELLMTKVFSNSNTSGIKKL